MKVSKVVASAGGAQWLQRAVALAKSIKAETGIKRQIIKGYVIEGRRVRKLRRALVWEPPMNILVFGTGLGRLGASDDAGVTQLRFTPVVTYQRDNLGSYHLSPPPEVISPTALVEVGIAQSLHLGPSPDDSVDGFYPYNSFSHAMVDVGDFERTYGLSFCRRVKRPLAIVGTLNLYTSDTFPQVFMFSYRLTGMNVYMSGKIIPRTLSNSLSLQLYSDWIEQHIGGDIKVVPVWPDEWPGEPFPADGFPASMWDSDSGAERFQAPWAYASVIELNKGESSAHADWRVCVRGNTPPVSGRDVWGVRSLYVFTVRTTAELSGGLVTNDTEPGPVTAVYNPLASADEQRRPVMDEAGYWRRNSFCAPCVGDGGVMVIGQVVDNDPAPELREDRFNAVLLSASGAFVELPLTSTEPRRKTLFIGGATAGDTVLMLNPYLDIGVMAVVDGTTGAVEIVSVPEWYAPLEFNFPNPDTASTSISEDCMRNQVSNIGLGLLAFPVILTRSTMTTTTYMAVYDYVNKTARIAGEMWTGSLLDQRGGVSRICVVQRATESSQAVLLGGYATGPADDEAKGGLIVISYDSGETWHSIGSGQGPARGLAVVGSAIYDPPSGRLWE